MPHRTLTDAATSAMALASSWWVSLTAAPYESGMKAGAAVLLAVRVAIAWREWREGRKARG